MEIRAETLKIRTADGEMPAHLARPSTSGPFPGAVVVMEAFSLNPNISAVADRIAREGYVTLAPDLYYRFGVPKAIEWMRKLEPIRVAADIAAGVAHLKSRPEVRGQRLRITSFCNGDIVALRSAAYHPADLAAVVAFYGGASLAGDLDLLARISAPVLALRGEQDDLIPLDRVKRLEEGFGSASPMKLNCNLTLGVIVLGCVPTGRYND